MPDGSARNTATESVGDRRLHRTSGDPHRKHPVAQTPQHLDLALLLLLRLSVLQEPAGGCADRVKRDVADVRLGVSGVDDLDLASTVRRHRCLGRRLAAEPRAVGADFRGCVLALERPGDALEPGREEDGVVEVACSDYDDFPAGVFELAGMILSTCWRLALPRICFDRPSRYTATCAST